MHFSEVTFQQIEHFLPSAFFVLLIFFLDRVTKIYVISLSKNNFDNKLFSSKYLDFTLIWNEGIAFGLMSFNNDLFYNILSAIILIITIVVLILALKNKGIKRYAFLSIFAGSLGNLYDRFFYFAVPDFIDFHFDGFHWFILRTFPNKIVSKIKKINNSPIVFSSNLIISKLLKGIFFLSKTFSVASF